MGQKATKCFRPKTMDTSDERIGNEENLSEIDKDGW
jgi:hypothetical protein